MSAFSMKGLGRSIWSTVEDVAHGVVHPHASGPAPHRGGSGSHVVDPAAASGLFGHYADARPAVGRPPTPMSHAEMAEFLDDGPAPEQKKKPAGVGRPPKPLSHAELAELLDDKPAGVGRPPTPMSREELADLLE